MNRRERFAGRALRVDFFLCQPALALVTFLVTKPRELSAIYSAI